MSANIVGSPAREKEFFNRERIIKLLWEKLETDNILLTAPRRFGKTSVMYKLYDEPKQGFKVIVFDLEPVVEPVDFVATLLEKLREDEKIWNTLRKSINALKNLLNKLELGAEIEGVDFKIKIKEELKKNWKEIGKGIITKLEKSDEKVILILDEFAIMIENFLDDRLGENEVKEFLHWFRSLRISPNQNNCRFVVGSSISIDHHLSKLGILATFNDFQRLEVGELENSEKAEEFLEKLLQDSDIILSQESKKTVLQLVGPPIPYFIQVMVSQIINKFESTGKTVEVDEVENIYKADVLGVTCKSYFQIYYDRLKYYNKINEKVSKEFLKELAIVGEVSKSNLYQKYLKITQHDSDVDGFNNVMSDLENDFYIKYKYDTDSYIFYSKILKDWWKRYYSL